MLIKKILFSKKMEKKKFKTGPKQFSSFMFHYYKQLCDILAYFPEDLIYLIIEFLPSFFLNNPSFLLHYETASHI